MIRKIIGIKNVGRFRNSATQGNPQLAKNTQIAGANGFGKTTLCAILRSLRTGNPAYILGRKTLGENDPPSVELLLDTSPVRFDGSAWTQPLPNLAIFDETFIARNVHSGEFVEIDHRRNLYRIIIGEEGVHLAEEEARLSAESRSKTTEITNKSTSIRPLLPSGLSIDEFLALPIEPDIDNKINEQKMTLEAVRQAAQIQARRALNEITLPALPEGLTSILEKTIEEISADAERQLNEHLATHSMENSGRTWLADGITFASGDTCPFCGQGVAGLPLISAFRAVFSETYKDLKAEITDLQEKIHKDFGEGAIGRLETQIEQNRGGVEFWSRFFTFEASSLSTDTDISDSVRTLGQTAMALVTRKASSPLDPIILDNAFDAALNTYNRVKIVVETVNTAIRTLNALITAKKEEIGKADVEAAETELARRKAIKARHEEAVARNCSDYNRLIGEKNTIEKAKNDIRSQLEIHTKKVVKPYEDKINEYLDKFNADFRLTETKHSYPGGTATSSYQLVINNMVIDIGDRNTPGVQPSFKNTLSAGDRSTLALSFFLAYLDMDPDRAKKIVILDDPFNSQDAYRRRQTVQEIKRIGNDCAQVIVLSHDATFLKQVWDKAPSSERASMTIADLRTQGSKLMPLNLEKVCQGRTATDIDDLQTFITSGAGNLLDLIRKIRVVLETHCWTTYPSFFQAGQDWLGEIVRKIREGGNDHPAEPLYDELDQINDYTSQYYHGEDLADVTPDQIDPTELTGYTQRTLRIVNAMQA